VFPRTREDGTRTVVVRCLDAQPSLSLTRTFTVLLGACAVHARRLVRDGHRETDLSQRALERDRARAIALGPRTRLDAAPGRPKAPDALRDLLVSLRRAHLGLGVTAPELAPLLAAVDLPALDVPFHRTDDLLRSWAGEGAEPLRARLARALPDARPGGFFLDDLIARHPGKLTLLMGAWEADLGLATGARV
jgi:hypothetical protein